MIEIKFLKSLPTRPLNQNKTYLALSGGDMYVDKEGNRFAYLSFVNHFPKPFFALQLGIKEFDATGALIKEERYFDRATYSGSGIYVLPEPIALEKECEAVDVYIIYCDYGAMTFYQDRFSSSAEVRVKDDVALPTLMAGPKKAEETPVEGNAENAEEGAAPAPARSPQNDLAVVTQQTNVKIQKNLFYFAPIVCAILVLLFFFLSIAVSYRTAYVDFTQGRGLDTPCPIPGLENFFLDLYL